MLLSYGISEICVFIQHSSPPPILLSVLVSAKTMVHLTLHFQWKGHESQLLYWHFVILVPYQSLEMGMLITGVHVWFYRSEQVAIVLYCHMTIKRALPVMIFA